MNNINNSEINLIFESEEKLDHKLKNIFVFGFMDDELKNRFRVKDKNIEFLDLELKNSKKCDTKKIIDQFCTKQKERKYDLIILYRFLEKISDPERFIKEILSVKNSETQMIFFIKNVNHINYRISFLNGLYNFLDNSNDIEDVNYWTLDKILNSLKKSHLRLKKITRIKEPLTEQDYDFNDFTIPIELVESIMKHPEWNVKYYILFVERSQDEKTQNILSEITDDSVTMNLKQLIQNYKNVIKQKDNEIKDLREVLKQKESSKISKIQKKIDKLKGKNIE